MSGKEGAKASSLLVTAISNTLIDFRYSATRATVEGCYFIAEALCHINNLISLDLSDNSFGDETLEPLVVAISLQVHHFKPSFSSFF